MNDQEYDESVLAHPELIPGNRTEAHLRVSAAVIAGVATCDKPTFLKAWWAIAWLYPGFHPDDGPASCDLPHAKEFTEEAFRRAAAGEIDDDLFHAAEASHNAIWLARIGSPQGPSGFKDGYIPKFPELIPKSHAEAEARIAALSTALSSALPVESFLEVWWAFFWLHPERNPEYHDEWEDEDEVNLTIEAFRRHAAGEISDEQMFPCEACHARILSDLQAGTLRHGAHAFDRRVVILTDGGLYLSRKGGVTPDKNVAARYYMIADRVADQIEAVRSLHGRQMSIEGDRFSFHQDGAATPSNLS